MVARVVPGIERIDLRVRLENAAEDHRLRLLFPTHRPATKVVAASSFDVMTRSLAKPDASKWMHPAPRHLPSPGLGLAERAHAGRARTARGRGAGRRHARARARAGLALTRGLAHALGSRGPRSRDPRAQCLEPIEAKLALLPGLDPSAARDAEIGLRAVAAGANPLVPAAVSLLEIEPCASLLSALKPAEHDDGAVLRLLNPSDCMLEARIRLGLPGRSATPVRLDETPIGEPRAVESGEIRLEVPARALRSLHLRP